MAPDVPTRPAAWAGVAALVACAALWSLNGPLIKLLSPSEPDSGAGVPGLTIACYRSLLGGLVVLPLAVQRARTLRNVPARWPIACVVAFTIMTACFVIATTQTAAANAILLQYTAPAWVWLLSPVVLRERPRRREAVWLAAALGGVAVIFFGNAGAGSRGLLIALVSGLFFAVLTMLIRGMRQVDANVVVAVNLLGSGLLLIPAMVLWGEIALSMRRTLLMLALGVVQFGLPYVLFAWALQRVEAHRAALIVLLEAVLNPLWTWLVVGERVPPATLLGGPLILLGVAGSMGSSARRGET